MAIIQKHVTINGKDFIYTYSNAGRKVVRDGIEYDEAYDPAEFNREYTEGSVSSDEDVTPEEVIDAIEGVL